MKLRFARIRCMLSLLSIIIDEYHCNVDVSDQVIEHSSVRIQLIARSDQTDRLSTISRNGQSNGRNKHTPCPLQVQHISRALCSKQYPLAYQCVAEYMVEPRVILFDVYFATCRNDLAFVDIKGMGSSSSHGIPIEMKSRSIVSFAWWHGEPYHCLSTNTMMIIRAARGFSHYSMMFRSNAAFSTST
eukprot:400198_1